MSLKPEREEILNSYSMNELLELVQEKAELNTQQKVKEIVERLNAFAHEGAGEPQSTIKKQDSIYHNPETSEDPSPRRTTKRARNKKPLGQHLLEVIGSKPMHIQEIYEAIQKNGYRSNSQDPKRIIYLELTKQVKNKNLVKKSRGQYMSA